MNDFEKHSFDNDSTRDPVVNSRSLAIRLGGCSVEAQHVMKSSAIGAWAALCLAIPAQAGAEYAAAPSLASSHVTQLSVKIGLDSRGSQVRRELNGRLGHALDAEGSQLPLRKAGQLLERVPSVDQMGCAWIPIGASKKQPSTRSDSTESVP